MQPEVWCVLKMIGRVFDVEDEVFQSSGCCGDEGRSFGIGMQVQVSNRHELLR